ncbi:MAG: ABC transporter permease [Anaerolineales bacterium]|nr:ABC transporter permease [Anaerolineales bacterium]
MRIIDLTLKDFSQMVRDWKFVFFLVVMPVGFTLLFGFIFSGGGNGEADARLPVVFLDEDQGRFSPALRQALDASRVIRLEDAEQDANLDELVTDGDVAAAVIVPAGYSESLTGDMPLSLGVIVDPAANAGITAQNEVQTAANRLVNALQVARISTQAYLEQGAFEDAAAQEAYFDAAVSEALAAWHSPPVTVAVEQAVVAEEEEPSPYGENPFAHSSPGMMAQFSIAGLIGAAEVLVLERKSRALQRLLTTAISRVEILAGHFLTMIGMIFLQLLLLTVFGQIFLDLDYFQRPLAALLMILASSFFAGSLGLLIGAIARTEEHVIVLSLVPMFILSGLGGAWMPLEFTSPTVQFLGHLTPVAWMMDGFKGILISGWGLVEVLEPAVALAGFGVLFSGLALWRFRFE